MEGNGMK